MQLCSIKFVESNEQYIRASRDLATMWAIGMEFAEGHDREATGIMLCSRSVRRRLITSPRAMYYGGT